MRHRDTNMCRWGAEIGVMQLQAKENAEECGQYQKQREGMEFSKSPKGINPADTFNLDF